MARKKSERGAKDRLEDDPRFLDRVAKARASLRKGLGVKLEDVGLD